MNRHGEFKMPGGKLTVADVVVEGGRLAQVQVSGDFFLAPDEALDAINAALTGLPAAADAADLAAAVSAGLPPGAQLHGVSPEAIATAVRRAIESGESA